jgi:hypothetical protein
MTASASGGRTGYAEDRQSGLRAYTRDAREAAARDARQDETDEGRWV